MRKKKRKIEEESKIDNDFWDDETKNSLEMEVEKCLKINND